MSTTTQRFAFTLPSEFMPVPDRSGPQFDDWMLGLMAPPKSWVAGSSIEADLERLTAALDSEPDDGRTWFVVIPSAPHHRSIAALGWINGFPAGAAVGDLSSTADALAQRQNPKSLRAAIEHRSVGGREIVTAHLIQGAAGKAISGARLVERCTALMVDQDLGLAVRLELTALDFRAFDDIVASACQLLESVTQAGGRQ